MSDRTPNLQLPLIAPSQAQKHVTHNEAILRLDSLTQLVIEDVDRDTPPVAVAEGLVYGIGSAPTGAWSANAGDLAIFANNGWDYLTPSIGWRGFVKETGDVRLWDGSAWITGTATELAQLTGLGIATDPDDTNRLSVESPASLFSHAGNDHRIVVNKAGETDTASLLYQSNWTGHAEIGLTGSDDLSIKVSPDGTTFQEALRFDSATAAATVRALQSGSVAIENDSVARISTPTTGGFLLLTVVGPISPDVSHAGIFVFDTSSAPDCLSVFGSGGMVSIGSAVLDGSTGAAGETTVAAETGQIVIENRRGQSARYSYTFIGGA